jgi:hypothetical protein
LGETLPKGGEVVALDTPPWRSAFVRYNSPYQFKHILQNDKRFYKTTNVSNQFTQQEIQAILDFLKQNPGKLFWYDEPFMDKGIMNDYHLILRHMIDAKYIEAYDKQDKGTSNKVAGVPRLGLGTGFCKLILPLFELIFKGKSR